MSKGNPEPGFPEELPDARANEIAVAHHYGQGLTNVEISRRTGVAAKDVAKIIRNLGLPTRNPERRIYVEALKKRAEAARARDEDPSDLLPPAPVAPTPLAARSDLDTASPADQYRAFVAAEGAKLLKESLPGIRPPRTVKELAELDNVIRRNLGLGGKDTARNKLSIDISLLTGTGAVRRISVEEDEKNGK